VLFRDDLAIELVLLALLIGQDRVPPFFKCCKSTIEAADAPAVEPSRAARQVG